MGKVKRPWQETEEILGRFGRCRREATSAYREFVLAGLKQGRRPELMGAGLLRSHGGWKEVVRLRRGQEEYRSDEWILGLSGFVEEVLKEAQSVAAARYSSVDLAILVELISEDLGIGARAALGGEEIGRHLGFVRFCPMCGCVILGEVVGSLRGKREWALSQSIRLHLEWPWRPH
jgi:hypothetical protein